MKRKVLVSIILTGIFVFCFGIAEANFLSGTATATGTVESGTPKFGDIVKKTGTGGLTIKSVEVLDKFGRVKRVSWKISSGKTSTSPTLEFTPALEVGDYVSIDLTTGNDGDFGYLDVKFR